MDGPTFLVEVVKALAWPLSSILIVILLRKPLGALLEGLRITRVKYGEWMAEFEQAKQQAAQALPKDAAAKALPPRIEIDDAMAASPTAVVVSAWNDLESTVLEIAAEAGVSGENFRQLITGLRALGVLKPETVHALDGLRQMRNLAVHAPGGEATPGRAKEFAAMAEAMRWTLRDQASRSGKPSKAASKAPAS
ncbi:MAG: DUF4145 domain-containing protein [Polyangiaceae bacterium]